MHSIAAPPTALLPGDEHQAAVGLAELLVGDPWSADRVVHQVVSGRPTTIGDPILLRAELVDACRVVHRRRHRGGNGGLRVVTEPSDAASKAVLDALDRLPYRFKVALVLHAHQGRSDGEAAAIVGCRPGTAARRRERALVRLRRALGGTIEPAGVAVQLQRALRPR